MTERPHPDGDLLVEVALGHAVGAARDLVAAHLAVCGACREEYRALADAVELALPAVPRVAPPPGFEADVLARLAAERTGARSVAGAPQQPGRPAHRPLRLAVAAGLVGLAIGGGLGALLADGDDEPPAVAVEWATPLLDPDGTEVGTVSPSWGAHGPVLVVDVSGGPAGQWYTCRLVLPDGSTQEAGRWQVAEGRPNSWVVPTPTAGVAVVELVTDAGTVWSSAAL